MLESGVRRERTIIGNVVTLQPTKLLEYQKPVVIIISHSFNSFEPRYEQLENMVIVEMVSDAQISGFFWNEKTFLCVCVRIHL